MKTSGTSEMTTTTMNTDGSPRLGFFDMMLLYVVAAVCLSVFAMGVLFSAAVVAVYTNIFEREKTKDNAIAD